MPHENAGCAYTGGARSLDELAILQRQGLAANDPCGGEPADRPDRDEQPRHAAAAKDRREDDDDEQIRQRIQHVQEAHHQLVGASTEVAGNRTPGNTDHQADDGGQQADQQ